MDEGLKHLAASESVKTSPTKKMARWKLVLQLAVTMALLGGILWYVGGVDGVVDVVADVELTYLVLAVVLLTVDRALMVYKWALLLRSRNVLLPFWQGMKIYCTSMIWGLFLPMTIGADTVRAILSSREGLRTQSVVASIVIERIVGFIASIVVGIIGLLILDSLNALDNRFDFVWKLALFGLVAALITFILSISRRTYDSVRRIMPEAAMRSRVYERISALHSKYVEFGSHPRTLSIFSVLTFLEQFVAIVFVWLVALALNVEVGLLFVAGAIPLSILVSRLPISLNGIGVFEGVFVLIMSLGDVSGTEAVSIALLARLVEIATWLPWWMAYSIELGKVGIPRLDAQ